ncbi:hydroxysqualene dehydroxylase HpnE [Intrasporangium sp.]|uniref:hydroxysqualene dehydroxylase HpnE n=1 Tax=Intrasporangium sp. TaxID=1925024 RepID=UPI0032221A27
MSDRPVIVIGGGLAGITAALDLAGAGRQVLLLEARPRLGGRAASARRDGRPLDTGVHVILRCYQQYRSLLRRLGVEHLVPIQDRLDITVLRPDGDRARLTRARRGPAPLHLLPALLRYAALPPAARLSAATAAAALRRVDPDDPRADLESFGSWLARHGQTRLSAERLWGLVSTAALNLPPAEASLGLAARVFRTGLLDGVDSGDIGIPVAPLAALHEEPTRQALLAAGARVTLGCKALGISRDTSGLTVTVRERAGAPHPVEAESVVLAVPHDHAAELVPADAAPDAADWLGLGHSAIVNVHLVLDRPVLPVPFAAVPQSPLQWVFDRTAPSGREGTGTQYLVCSVSAADTAVRTRAEDLVRLHLSELRRHLPEARRAALLDGFVTREPQATFRQGPGSRQWRPGPATRWDELALAGAWTVPGWPDTLEAAVRSGHAAADLLAGADRGGASRAGQARRPARTPLHQHDDRHEMEVTS